MARQELDTTPVMEWLHPTGRASSGEAYEYQGTLYPAETCAGV